MHTNDHLRNLYSKRGGQYEDMDYRFDSYGHRASFQ